MSAPTAEAIRAMPAEELTAALYAAFKASRGRETDLTHALEAECDARNEEGGCHQDGRAPGGARGKRMRAALEARGRRIEAHRFAGQVHPDTVALAATTHYPHGPAEPVWGFYVVDGEPGGRKPYARLAAVVRSDGLWAWADWAWPEAMRGKRIPDLAMEVQDFARQDRPYAAWVAERAAGRAVELDAAGDDQGATDYWRIAAEYDPQVAARVSAAHPHGQLELAL